MATKAVHITRTQGSAGDPTSVTGGEKRWLSWLGGFGDGGADVVNAAAVEVVGPKNVAKLVHVRRAVISNASVWDTKRLLEQQPAAVEAARKVEELAGTARVGTAARLVELEAEGESSIRTGGVGTAVLEQPAEGVLDRCGSVDEKGHRSLRQGFLDYVEALELNDSMMHLHLAFESRPDEDLPFHTYFLESEHSGSNGWPTIVIPSTAAPSLAPAGYHVLHATIAEPFEPWQHLRRGSPEYNARKASRGAILWDMVRQIVPDIDTRVKFSSIGTPLSHARFLRRIKGTYGPSNLLTLTSSLPQAVQPLDNVWCCGDSVFPGVGTPAVAASGMWVANTLVPVESHLRMLQRIGV